MLHPEKAVLELTTEELGVVYRGLLYLWERGLINDDQRSLLNRVRDLYTTRYFLRSE